MVPPSPFEDVPDAAQVRALAEHFSTADETGELSNYLDLASLSSESREAIVSEEGWILGVQPIGPEPPSP
jgi:hypothetical protein